MFTKLEEIIKRSTEEIRQSIEAIKQIIETEPLDLKTLSSKVESLCKHMDVIGETEEQIRKDVPIPLRKINDECLEPILEVAGKSPKNQKKECIIS
jgi:uncharacterized protein YaaN involved in tellurite resistance